MVLPVHKIHIYTCCQSFLENTSGFNSTVIENICSQGKMIRNGHKNLPVQG
jgi:hypothetical protein